MRPVTVPTDVDCTPAKMDVAASGDGEMVRERVCVRESVGAGVIVAGMLAVKEAEDEVDADETDAVGDNVSDALAGVIDGDVPVETVFVGD